MAIDRAQSLAVAYREIALTRMRGLPICNARLEVEAIGFRDWEGRRVGVVVTPWFMNLVLLPGAGDDWSARPQGEKSEWCFPGETVELTAAHLEGAGVHLSAALFSGVQDFPDQETARAVALEALGHLLEPRTEEDDRSTHGLSRRDLLRGLFIPPA